MVHSDMPLSLVRDPGNPHLIKRLQELEAYDCSVVRLHVAERLKWDESRAKEAEFRTKQFMALSFLDMGEAHAPEADVDEFWHGMVMHTRWYHAFCDLIFGEYYHHMPEPAGAALDEERRERSVVAASLWFGERRGFDMIMNCRRCQPMFTARPGLAPRR